MSLGFCFAPRFLLRHLPRLRLQLQHLVAEVPGNAMSRAAPTAGALTAVVKMGALAAVALRRQVCYLRN